MEEFVLNVISLQEIYLSVCVHKDNMMSMVLLANLVILNVGLVLFLVRNVKLVKMKVELLRIAYAQMVNGIKTELPVKPVVFNPRPAKALQRIVRYVPMLRDKHLTVCVIKDFWIKMDQLVKFVTEDVLLAWKLLTNVTLVSMKAEVFLIACVMMENTKIL